MVRALKEARLAKEENKKIKNDTKLLPMTVIIINLITVFAFFEMKSLSFKVIVIGDHSILNKT
jgi:hypothetical protein